MGYLGGCTHLGSEDECGVRSRIDLIDIDVRVEEDLDDLGSAHLGRVA